MFDCVMPTRNGRNGMLFTKDGIINMRNKKWETDFSPIEADGASSVDTLYSKAYLRHLDVYKRQDSPLPEGAFSKGLHRKLNLHALLF